MLAIFFSQKRNIFIIAAALAILTAIATWLQYARAPSDSVSALPPPAADVPPSTAPPSPPTAGGTASPPAPVYAGLPVQALDSSPDILKQVPADTYDTSRKELADLAVSLAANPRDASGWMRVAYIKRFYGDYAGTADAYEYLNVIAESDALAFYNLAGLYGYYLKQPARAVPKYEAALERDPMNPTYYSGFSDFYREVMKDLPAAARVLERGLAKVQSDMNLSVSYAALLATMGKTARAIEYYEKVLARADLDVPERTAITAEVNRLKAGNP